MKTYTYQIDRRDAQGNLDGYEMIKAANITTALQKHLGADYPDYKTTKKRINGKLMITATCGQETSSYLEVSRVG